MAARGLPPARSVKALFVLVVEAHHDIAAQEVGLRHTAQTVDLDLEARTLTLEQLGLLQDLTADEHAVSGSLNVCDADRSCRSRKDHAAHRVRGPGVNTLRQLARACREIDLSLDH